jgi:hypothetical protein
MKKTVQVLLGIAALNGAALFQSCDREKCGGLVLSHYDIKGLNVQHLISSGGQVSPAQPGIEYSATEYTLELNLPITYYSLSANSFSDGNAAFACSPVENGYRGTNERISKLIITSDSTWSSSFPAGADLNDLFVAYATSPSGSANFMKLPLDSLQTGRREAVPSLSLIFNSAVNTNPVAAKTHRFTVTYEQTNGEKYTATLPPITFK